MSRKLTLMTLTELRDCLKLWRRRTGKCRAGSFSWRICRWMVERIVQEIVFKDWLLVGLKKITVEMEQSVPRDRLL